MSHLRVWQHRLMAVLVGIPMLASAVSLSAQVEIRPEDQALTKKINPPDMFVGDMPLHPGPLANLATDTGHASVEAAMRKVADWQLARAAGKANLDWTYATLYRGFLAASDTLKDPRYADFVAQVGKDHQWAMGPHLGLADDEAVAQSFARIYLRTHDPKAIAPMKAEFDAVISGPPHEPTLLWWWCDSLFMAPTAWAQLSNITGDPKYRDYMDQQWWITSRLLYSHTDHLFARDQSYIYRHEKNGRSLYWARGNGWVVAGLVGVLEQLPKDDPRRARFQEQYLEMMKALLAIQGTDGLWRSGLLDQDSYPRAEVSGSSFFLYGMAWGIRNGLLDRQTYLPAVEKGWAGLVKNIYADGRLGSIQPIGGAPGPYEASSSFVFGVGAFLMAGSEVDQLAGSR